MASIYGKLVLLFFLFSSILADGASPRRAEPNTALTTENSSGEDNVVSKTTIALIVGFGLTTFFVVFIAFFMIRGYKNITQPDNVEDIQDMAEKDVVEPDHVAAEKNLGGTFSDEKPPV